MIKIHQSRNFNEFMLWVDELVLNKKSSGADPSESLAHYTQLNQKRMQRITKTLVLNDDLLKLIQLQSRNLTFVVITEAWCGDSAQSLPVIAKIVEASDSKFDLKIIMRDEHNDWIEKYKTNGSRAIPKLIVFDANDNEIFNWGPRPMEAQTLLLNWKANPEGRSWEDFEVDLHTWYAKDKTLSTQAELKDLLMVNLNQNQN